MSLAWDLSQIQSPLTTCYEYRDPALFQPLPDEGWELLPDGRYRRMKSSTLALLWSAPTVRLSTITPLSYREWLYRLDALFDCGIHFLSAPSGDGEGPVPLRIPHRIILSHMNLRVSTYPDLSSAEFDRFIRDTRMSTLARELHPHPQHPPSSHDFPL